MILRHYYLSLIGLLLNVAAGERWSRQVSNSEWIPLAHPRSQQSPAVSQLSALPPIQNLNLPPALRQEYQQQLQQLQKTQESIQKLLLLQQQLRSQQQLLQNQAYLPNAVGPDEEKQFRRPSDTRTSQELTQELPPPELSSEVLPAVYSNQEFKQENQQEAGGQLGNEERPETNEEVQVVYVPAETLAQRGQSKEEVERNRDHKHFSFRQNHQRFPQQHDTTSELGNSNEDVSYVSEVVQFPRGQEATDAFFKEARQKELDRLNEEREAIQKQAKIQAAARQREQERVRQREAERKQKELAKLEELARQKELERIRDTRERQRLDAIKRERERAAKVKEEKARQAEIERLATLERQKKAEIERSQARQQELEKFARQEEEARLKELAKKKAEAEANLQPPAAEHLVNQQHQQHHTETVKHHKRPRNKLRQRLPTHHHKTPDAEHQSERNQDASLTPNQPPLAVFMGSDLDAAEVKLVDVLRVLRSAKTIAVLDQVLSDTPKVFVGPSNLDPPQTYVKFELPYLSSLDTNRVERRVDKLPFFVAPLSFTPPPGYAKIPFPSPHIGSVIVNTIENTVGHPAASQESRKPSPNPLIEPNAFIASSGQGSAYQATYETPSGPAFASYPPEHVTQQYQSTPVYPDTSAERFKYRQPPQQQYEQSPGSIAPYQEQVTALPRPQDSSAYQEQSYSGQSTADPYRRPTVVSSYSYNSPDPVSTTPIYQENYSNTRVQPNKNQEIASQLSQINQHDFSQHRHENTYQRPSSPGNETPLRQQYPTSPVPNSYEESSYRSPVGPTQYSLPAELPAIHPQLPGLVNALLDEKTEQVTTTSVPVTTSTATTTTTTSTETPTTTYRSRQRHRGRIASRPTTTSTSSPTTRGYSERTRRPFNRSRSRYSTTTTTTEDYRETSYDPTKAKVPEATPKYQEQFRRPITTKPKFKSRERTTYESTTLNQIPNIQSSETLSDEGVSPEDANSRQTPYSSFNAPAATDSPSPNAYLNPESIENPSSSYSSDIDYSKSQNYARPAGPPRALANDPQDQYHERFSAPAYQPNLERHQPTNTFDYDIGSSTLAAASPTSGDYPYYQDKTESVESTSGSNGQSSTEFPNYSQVLEYRPEIEQGQLINSQEFNQPDERNPGSLEHRQLYNQYSQEVSQAPHQSEAYSEHQVDLTTESLTTTTTESPSVVIRQRTRPSRPGRPRPEAVIQTQPRGSQDEYVRFSAVNQAPSGARGSSGVNRPRDYSRPRPKARPNYPQAQVQSEGNEYVRIQSANRPSYPKTIVQAAAPGSRSTTTTTVAPLTTTEESQLSADDIEYGFIRPPNFNQPQHHLSSKFRGPVPQIHLQDIAPTDETAEDSSPALTQVTKNRPKYLSPNRPRATTKSSYPVTTTPSSLETFSTKSRVRADEPKNRIHTRVRRPGRRRTTTTSTTTEYTLEGNNNLPLDENYPRLPIKPTEGALDRQSTYETRFDTHSHGPTAAAVPSDHRSEYSGENYPQQAEFSLNFGGDAATQEQQQDPNNSGQNSHYKYRAGSAGRLKPYQSHAVGTERDIYGSESQWSTKLTKSSFQPVNQLGHDEKSEQGNQENKQDVPEIITAQPDDEAFVTVRVSSEDQSMNRSEIAAIESAMEAMDFGEKISPSATAASSVESSDSNSGSDILHRPRIGGRRRRVRVRVRPAPRDDFVTAESQHFNSAVNNLVQDHVKHDHFDSQLNFKATKNLPEIYTTVVPTTAKIFTSEESVTPNIDTTTINYTESAEVAETTTVPTLDETTTQMPGNTSQESITSTENPSTDTTVTYDQSTSSAVSSSSPAPTISLSTMTVPRKSWDSTKAYADWLVKKMEKPILLDGAAKSKDPDSNNMLEVSKSSTETTNDPSHPKNHRSEWSEVQYPSNRLVFGYGRSEKLSSTTPLPGFDTKSQGDSSVNTLSDYVQAIFDTMKNADEEGAIIDNAPNLWSDDVKTSTVTQEPSSATPAALALAKSTVESVKESTEKSIDTSTSKVAETMDTATGMMSRNDNAEATTLKFPTSETVVPSISTTLETLTSVEPAKNATSKLSTVVRTSTTTRVSHMTEICYRGRCVMTKPRKDFHQR